MNNLTPQSPIVADAHALYLAFGGRQHRRIEAAMRAKGYTRFNRRVFYDRLERGRLRLGWIRRFKWNDNGSGPPGLAGGFTRLRNLVDPKTQTRSFVSPTDGAIQTEPPTSRLPEDVWPKAALVGAAGRAAHRSRPAASNYTPRTQHHPSGLRKRRRTEVREFRRWLQRVSPSMRWDWAHLNHLYRKLADVTSGKTKRLMIFMPPRHGKSELVTVRYPAYRLRQDAELNVIVASYNQRLANRFSRKIRITWEDATQMDAPTQTEQPTAETQRRRENETAKTSANGATASSTSHAETGSSPRLGDSAVNRSQNRLNTVSEWETGMGGGVRAVGVGAGITGYGAKLVIIDDPIRSRSDAESETYRNRSWEWYKDDIYTRLEPDAAIILIQTRWHEDDLAGRLLEEMKNGGDQWEVVSMPAVAEDDSTAETPRRGENEEAGTNGIEKSNEISTTAAANPSTESLSLTSPRLGVSAVQMNLDPIGRRPGDALCPERFNLEELSRIRRQLGEYSFSALYQQRPMPLEGGLFKKKWFTQIVDRAPDGLRWFRAYDLAISTKTSADFTASARCAMDRNGNIYIADVFRARLEYPDQRKFVVDRLINERDTEHCIEDALHAKAFIQDLRREPSLARHAIRLVSVTNDKFTRALAWANRAEEGKIILVRGPWLNQFLDEVCSFTNSAHDDQVDAVSLAVQMIDRRKRQFWSF